MSTTYIQNVRSTLEEVRVNHPELASFDEWVDSLTDLGLSYSGAVDVISDVAFSNSY